MSDTGEFRIDQQSGVDPYRQVGAAIRAKLGQHPRVDSNGYPLAEDQADDVTRLVQHDPDRVTQPTNAADTSMVAESVQRVIDARNQEGAGQ